MLDAIRSEQYKTRHTKIFTILCVGALVLGEINIQKYRTQDYCNTKKWYE